MNNIIKIIENIAPVELAEEWDNCGWQIKLNNTDNNKVMVALDITSQTVEEAISEKVGLIITHHPLFFGKISGIDSTVSIGKNAINLIKNSISVYSAHTNFDKTIGGNNDYLAKKIALLDVKQYGDYLRIGTLANQLSLEEFRTYLAKVLDCSKEKMTLIGNDDKLINRVGICTGAGAPFWMECMQNGADVFITGDVKYHDALTIKEEGYTVLDCGHYQTEIIFLENMVNLLRQKCQEIEVISSKKQIDPFI